MKTKHVVGIVIMLAAGICAFGLLPAIAEAQESTAQGAPTSGAADAGFDLAALHTPGGLTSDDAAAQAVRTAPSVVRAEAAVRAAQAGQCL